jgi:hypothetical protein
MADFDNEKFDWKSISTITYDRFSRENLELLQMKRKALDESSNIVLGKYAVADRLNTLFDSGYINQNVFHELFTEYIRGIMFDDIPIDLTYNIINNEHSRRISGETIVPVSIKKEEIGELLYGDDDYKLKINHFIILFYIGESDEEQYGETYNYEASALLLKTEDGIELYRRNWSNGLTLQIEFNEFMETQFIEDMYILAIKGVNERHDIVHEDNPSPSKRRKMYSPLRRKLKKSPVKRRVTSKSPLRRKLKKSPAKRRVTSKSPIRRKLKKSPAKRRVTSKSPIRRKLKKLPVKRRVTSKSPLRRKLKKSPAKRRVTSKSPIRRKLKKSPVKRRVTSKSPIRRKLKK